MRPPKETILKLNRAAFVEPKHDKGSGTEQEFRRLCTADLVKIYKSSGPRLDRLAARTVLLDRGYNVPDPFVPGVVLPDELPVLHTTKDSTVGPK